MGTVFHFIPRVMKERWSSSSRHCHAYITENSGIILQQGGELAETKPGCWGGQKNDTGSNTEPLPPAVLSPLGIDPLLGFRREKGPASGGQWTLILPKTLVHCNYYSFFSDLCLSLFP